MNRTDGILGPGSAFAPAHGSPYRTPGERVGHGEPPVVRPWPFAVRDWLTAHDPYVMTFLFALWFATSVAALLVLIPWALGHAGPLNDSDITLIE